MDVLTKTQIETRLYLKTDFDTCRLNNKPEYAKKFLDYELWWKFIRTGNALNVKFIMDNDMLNDDPKWWRDSYRKTPLDYAKQMKNLEMVNIFYDKNEYDKNIKLKIRRNAIFD